MKVLIIKISSMGDILHTFPALTDAMKAIPNISFDWIVEECFNQIPTWHPAVNNVIIVAFRRWKKNWFNSLVRKQRNNFKNKIQSNHYDVIIDAQGLIKSSILITRLTKGYKHGYNYNTIREPFASFFYNYKHNVNKQQHAVERIRELFSKSLYYSKPNNYGNYSINKQLFFNLQKKDTKQYLVFLHSTTRSNKHWPEKNWRDLIKLTMNHKIKIKLIWNSINEYKRSQRLAYGFPHVEILPKLTLKYIANILLNAKSIVSVDTGLSHLSAALNKPNITLFGPTNPKFIGGYGQNQYPCLPLIGNNMKNISAQQVYQLLQKINIF
ncbi:Lipopolysaccharide heptosyltransferase 1 [Serratia symbiotica]|nr:Lipopolysaccharide heptosyltransferase 1 [Serratia symbiotica]